MLAGEVLADQKTNDTVDTPLQPGPARTCLVAPPEDSPRLAAALARSRERPLVERADTLHRAAARAAVGDIEVIVICPQGDIRGRITVPAIEAIPPKTGVIVVSDPDDVPGVLRARADAIVPAHPAPGILASAVTCMARMARRLDESQQRVERWHRLVDTLPQIVLILDTEGTVRYCNHDDNGELRIDIVGRNLFEELDPETARATRNAIDTTVTTWQPHRFRLSTIHPGRGPIHYAAQCVPIGEPGDGRIALTLHDASPEENERHEAASAFDRLRQMFDNMPVAAFCTDARGRIVDCNQALRDIIHLPSARDIGAYHLPQLFADPDVREGLLFDARHSTDGCEIDAALRRFDRAQTWVRGKIRAQRDAMGQILGYEGFLHDASARRTEETELAEAHARLTFLIDNAPVYVTETDRDGMITYVNRTRAGTPPAQIIGTSVYDQLDPSLHAQAEKILHAAITEGTPGTFAVTTNAPDGHTARYATRITPARRGDRITGALLYTTDITGISEDPTARIEPLAPRESHERLAVDRFAHHVVNLAAHELATPLTPALVQLHMLNRGQLGPLLPEQAAALTRLTDSLERLTSVARRVRDLAAWRSDQIRPTVELIRLDRLVDEVSSRVRDRAHRHDIRFHALTPTPAHVQGDAARLSHAVRDLIDLAFREAPKGASVRVAVAADAEEAQFTLHASDLGIPVQLVEEVHGEMPDPSQQQWEDDYNYPVLILTLVRGVVEAHGGRSWCRGHSDGSATICFALPLADPDAPRSPMPATPTTPEALAAIARAKNGGASQNGTTNGNSQSHGRANGTSAGAGRARRAPLLGEGAQDPRAQPAGAPPAGTPPMARVPAKNRNKRARTHSKTASKAGTEAGSPLK